ncbi:hypothetical protein BDN72DRAFT_115465 [Pluteus cervinus]|uniref:Uncharacterized protein n=1 Tax=Pluteus cervinus TaxID=181527 RepID=A0ACD3AP19_9AGAR|nr:hypothetical protein BDN72DRAFT_115465 [Pluteus cervinus]
MRRKCPQTRKDAARHFLKCVARHNTAPTSNPFAPHPISFLVPTGNTLKGISSHSPQLTTVRIIPICQLNHGHPHDTPNCQSKVETILSACTHIPDIVLDLIHSSPWDLSIWPTFPDASEVTLTLNKSYSSTSTSSCGVDMPSWLYPPPSLVSAGRWCYSRITQIALSTALSIAFLAPDSLFVHGFFDFLSLCLSLKVLTIINTSTYLTDARWMHQIRDGLLEMLKDACRNLEKVRLEDVDGLDGPVIVVLEVGC